MKVMLSLIEERQKLPVYECRQQICDLFDDHETLVLVGETGSGKTTQIPQFLYKHLRDLHHHHHHDDDGGGNNGVIGVTQPRRVAAVTVARRVAAELGTQLGDRVGYAIRFDDRTTPGKTKIKFMTDGILLREAMLDPLLRRYTCIILDEAHERTVHTDVLFGVLRQCQEKRRQQQQQTERTGSSSSSSSHPLKLIVMSATLNAAKFSEFLNGCPVLVVQGRQHPVDVFYTMEPQADYVDAAANTVLQLHLDLPMPSSSPSAATSSTATTTTTADVGGGGGDILVFLPGQDDIESCQALIRARLKVLAELDPDTLEVLPLYAALPTQMQLRVFERAPAGKRKVILATNIAETSVTINGVRCVVDCGLQKTRGFNPRLGLDTLAVVPISKANARQRAGRAGREAPGCCYRLFTEASFASLLDEPIPEIVRCDLSTVVLQLKALGVADVTAFPFIDRPSVTGLRRALALLAALKALVGRQAQLTPLGRQMAAFPLDPRYARCLIAAADTGCCEEVLTVIALLGLDEPLFVPPSRDRRQDADKARQRFAGVGGDHFMMLTVFREFEQQLQQPGGQKLARRWCRDHCLSDRALLRAQTLRQQLAEYVDAAGLRRESCRGHQDTVARAFVSGFFMNAAVYNRETKCYKSLVDRAGDIHIHPSSVLRGKRPPAVLYMELVLTQKNYMRDVIVIDQQWLVEIAPHFFSHSTGAKKLS